MGINKSSFGSCGCLFSLIDDLILRFNDGNNSFKNQRRHNQGKDLQWSLHHSLYYYLQNGKEKKVFTVS